MPTVSFFARIYFLTAIYSYVVIPETKGQTFVSRETEGRFLRGKKKSQMLGFIYCPCPPRKCVSPGGAFKASFSEKDSALDLGGGEEL